MYKRHLKRLCDIFISIVSFILISWLFLLIMVLIKVTSKGPIFFTQKRIGQNKREFYILKFRTMKISTPSDVPTHLLQDPQQYITKVGKFLRKTSLDELPQLINIIKGDMSLVGPRPALWNQLDLISERDRYKANSVRPGLTGWAQVNGRDELQIIDKARLDGEYVLKQSFIFDLYCIALTIFCVFGHKGYKEGATESSKNLKETTNG